MDSLTDLLNSKPRDDFSGLTPSLMHGLLYSDDNIIVTNNATRANHEIPILKLIYSIISKIDPEKGVKLTPAGYLPVKMIKEIYSEKIIIDREIENGITKLSKEFDSESIHTARLIGTLSGYLRKTNTKICVTKKGKSFINNEDNLKNVFNTFGSKYNLGYFDGYDNTNIAQIGFRYSLYLLLKFGSETRNSTFYAEKYFKAFPQIGEMDDRDIHCYNIRTFDRFFRYFGIIAIEGRWDNQVFTGTDLLTRYFKVKK